MGLVHKKDIKKVCKPGRELEEPVVRLSKTQKKIAALELQKLGERLVTLTNEQLKQIGLDEDVLSAVRIAKTIKKHGPLSRQMQHIGALMRRCDPTPIREFFAALDQGKARLGK